jgi:hypothetical protein
MPCGLGPAGECPGARHGCDWHDDEPAEYDPGPEYDYQGGMSEDRTIVTEGGNP